MKQEHFRGKILRRMMGEEQFEKFCSEYDAVKVVNAGRAVFEEDLKTTRYENR